MSGSLNKVMLIGRLGKDPEVRSIPSGDKVANFSMATSESYTKDGEKNKKTEWHNIVAWRKLAEIIEKYVHKGDLIYIEGKLTTRSWENDNGQRIYRTEIIANQMQMIGGKQQSEQGQSSPSPVTDNNGVPFAPEDGLPF